MYRFVSGLYRSTTRLAMKGTEVLKLGQIAGLNEAGEDQAIFVADPRVPVPGLQNRCSAP